MSFSTTDFDPAEDWDLFDGRDDNDPWFVPYDAATDSYGVAIEVPALFRATSIRPASMGDGVTSIAQTYVHIPTSYLNGREPVRGDRIQRFDVNGVPTEVWYVQEVDTQTFATRARLTCTRGIE